MQVRPDRQIAERISAMVQGSAVRRAVSSTPMAKRPPLPTPDGALRSIFTSIRKATGVDFTHYKHSTIRRRIGRRLSLHTIESLQTYAKYLDTDPEEVTALFGDMLIHVTSFFRDPEAYELLKTRLLPKYMEISATCDSCRHAARR
jgi:two-component system CheB/CheR fusion protein